MNCKVCRRAVVVAGIWVIIMLKAFLQAVRLNWVSLVTGGASIPFTIFAFWADTPLQRTAWAAFAIGCFIVALFRIWVSEYLRAETAEAKLTVAARPWVIIDSYLYEYLEDEELGNEYLSEKIRIVNRGQAPAVNITIPDLCICGSKARVVVAIPTLGPDDQTDVSIRNLRELLESVRTKLRKSMPEPSEGRPRLISHNPPLLLPFAIEYRGLDHKTWTTEHTVSLDANLIRFSIARPNDSKQWTDLSMIESQPTSGHQVTEAR